MELSKNYLPADTENRWYSHWLDKKYFNSTPDDREPYTIVIPPPNVTGVLHMGHCLNNTIQDILARYNRMNGKNVCWVPGTDHASIATEAKVVQMLREKGITKSSLSRDRFLEYAWEWKEKYGGIILQQMKKLGCSLDWDRVTFTMDDDYYKSVIDVFLDLYKKGLIYRGKRMINWDTKALTALSDEEVIFKDTQSKLYHLRYKIEAADEWIIIATVRPETILGDTAICVNPNDERYKHLHGKYAFVPLINRRIPIITDDYVTMEFGTGALKVTPAHDMNDYQLGQKHSLEVIDIMNDDGTFNEAAQLLTGEDRFEARKKIIPLLEAEGALIKIEDYPNQVGHSERTDSVVEPRLSMQWWVKMKPLAEPALKAVEDGEIKFHPAKFANTYRYWMANIKDWCISRQLWWGHRIPAWYAPDGSFAVAANREDAYEQFKKQWDEANIGYAPFTIDKLNQDEDCLDTWFSSWLWPFEVFKGYSNPNNAEINYYYPTDTLVTAPEIIFFWVARMIMSGLEYKHAIPFKDVYFTGIVRDKLGRKMSKQLGNSPDLLGLIDLYGADAVRFGIMIASPAGNDLLFDESSLEQGRNFNNKLWNALKLVKEVWQRSPEFRVERINTNIKAKGVSFDEIYGVNNDSQNFAVAWFKERLNEVSVEYHKLINQFRLSEALKLIYNLIWDDFCSWYLEWLKPESNKIITSDCYDDTIEYFEKLLQLLHPFMPFVTEDIYHKLKISNEDVCIKQFNFYDTLPSSYELLSDGTILKKIISSIRDAKNKNQIKPKDLIKLHIQTETPDNYKPIENILAKQVNALIQYTNEPVANSIVIAVEKDKFFIESEKELDATALKEELLKDLAHQQSFLQSVLKKLSNERFVQNAKAEVVDLEKKKQADAEARIKTIEESLQNLH